MEITKPCAPATENVVLALTPATKESFFKSFDSGSLPSVTCHWLDTSKLNAQLWEEALFDLRPSVLVTGWGTPALTRGFANSEDSPLRYICHLAGGVKSIVPRRMIERGLLVSNWGQAISHTVAEHAVLLVLGLLRNLPEWNGFISGWQSNPHIFPTQVLSTRSLRGKRVGIHGFGAIAREIVQMLRPFHVELSAYSYGVPGALFEENQVKPTGSLEELFAGSEIIIECEALTPHTKGTVNESILRLLPENAIFVNVGRGDIVDEEALIQKALEGKLCVGLDVYKREPISPHYPLLSAPNVLLSPHIAGPTEDVLPELGKFALTNLQRFMNGDQVEGAVSLEIYDRST
jgi:phosphoglycerate dehydrogenase-like enzyme